MAPEKMAPEKMALEKMAPGKKGTRKKWHYVNLEKMAPQEQMSARGPSNSARVFLPSYPVYMAEGAGLGSYSALQGL